VKEMTATAPEPINVPVRIELSLEIDIATPKGAGKKPFVKMSSHEQHAAKLELLKHLSGPKVLAVLGMWQNLSSDLDHHWHDTVPKTAKAYLQDRVDLANFALKGELKHELVIGDPCPGQICTKMPSCGHDCRHCFELMRADLRDPTKLVNWNVTSSQGVKAHVMISLCWSTPAGAGMKIPAAADAAPAVAGPINGSVGSTGHHAGARAMTKKAGGGR